MELGPLQTKCVEALESGKYKQGFGALCINDEYCCLGVFCQELIPDTKKPKADCYVYGVYGDYNSAWLPEQVADMLDMYGRNGLSDDKENSLAGMNDNGISHKEIAAKIRENPSKYFRSSK